MGHQTTNLGVRSSNLFGRASKIRHSCISVSLGNRLRDNQETFGKRAEINAVEACHAPAGHVWCCATNLRASRSFLIQVPYIAATIVCRRSSGVLIESSSPTQRMNPCRPGSPNRIYWSSPETGGSPSTCRSYQHAPSTAIFAGPLGTSCSSSYRPWYAPATTLRERFDFRSLNCRNSRASDALFGTSYSSRWTLRPFGKCPLRAHSMLELCCPFMRSRLSPSLATDQ